MYFESISLPLIISFISLCAAIMAFSMIRQVMIAKRTGIDYESFDKKKPLFNLKPLLVFLIAVVAVFAYGIVIAILTSLSNVTRIYISIIIPMCLALVFVFVNELRIGSKNKDLRFFSSERTKITSLIREKADVLDSLSEYETRLNRLKDKWASAIKELNDHISVAIKDEHCEEIAKLETLIGSLREKACHADEALIKRFSLSLTQYLQTNVTEDIAFPQFETVDESYFESLVSSIEAKLRELIFAESLGSVSRKEIPSIEDMIGLLELNASLSNNINNLVLASFAFAEGKEGRMKYLEYLYSNKVIIFEMVLDCLNKKRYWIFDVNPFVYFENGENLDLLAFVIDNNLTGAIYPLLRYLKQSNVTLFDTALSKAPEKNKCTDLISAYIDLTRTNFAFGHESNIYENMTYALASYYKNESNEEYAFIQNVIDQQSFFKNKRLVVEGYLSALHTLEEQKTIFIAAYISYVNSAHSTRSLFKPGKMISLFAEYLSNLNKNKLVKMSLLICSVVLLEETDEAIIKEVINTLSHIELTKELYGKKLTTKAYQEIGKTILGGLLTRYNKDSLSIINRIEDERLCYEKLARL